jgi:hypothetical protein
MLLNTPKNKLRTNGSILPVFAYHRWPFLIKCGDNTVITGMPFFLNISSKHFMHTVPIFTYISMRKKKLNFCEK